jgi:hypothetical protein
MRYALLVLLLSLTAAGYANDAAVNGVGGTVAPMESHPSIRMVREKVDAKIGWDGVKVRCEFVFKNEGPATTVEMGFPERSWGDSAKPIVTTEFKGFNSWVDGKSVSTKLIPSVRSQSMEYEAWHVKDVRFGKNQTRTVVDEYTSPLGGDSIGGSFFSYVLRTGKIWKGNIGEAVVTVDASDVDSVYQPAFIDENEGYVQKGSTIIWRAKDFEPSRDIHVYLEPWRVWIGPSDVPVAVSDPRLFGEERIAMLHVLEIEDIEGCQVSWNNARKECTVTYRGHSLQMKAGSTRATLNGKKIILPAAPQIKWSSYLHVPIAAVSAKLGIPVERDDKARSIYIGQPKRSNRLTS